eukprot:6530671-Pyramimonas_sp.AAC.1
MRAARARPVLIAIEFDCRTRVVAQWGWLGRRLRRNRSGRRSSKDRCLSAWGHLSRRRLGSRRTSQCSR